MNDNDDVMGFNDEPETTGGYDPENIPDSAYDSAKENTQNTQPDNNTTQSASNCCSSLVP